MVTTPVQIVRVEPRPNFLWRVQTADGTKYATRNALLASLASRYCDSGELVVIEAVKGWYYQDLRAIRPATAGTTDAATIRRTELLGYWHHAARAARASAAAVVEEDWRPMTERAARMARHLERAQTVEGEIASLEEYGVELWEATNYPDGCTPAEHDVFVAASGDPRRI